MGERFEYVVSGLWKPITGRAGGAYAGSIGCDVEATYIVGNEDQMRDLAEQDELDVMDFSFRPTSKRLDSRLDAAA